MQRVASLHPSLPANNRIWTGRSLVSLLDFAPRLSPSPVSRSRCSPSARMAVTSAHQGPQLLSVAPMMDWTDVHYRQMARLISKHTWLYTEMVVDQTIIHNPITDRFLWFPPEQRPIVCQLGGSDPAKLAAAAAIVARYGYNEINLNCGCPSDRVAGAGCFGASLMLQPANVATCCAAMRQALGSAGVTVKCRLGVDDVDSYQALCNFIRVVHEGSGVSHFIMHARKCILNGLSPHENRTIPPLRHAWVWALNRDFPHLDFSLNGGLDSCHQAAAALQHSVDGASIHGVMIGRAAYNHPWACLADADIAVFGAETNAATSRREVLAKYVEYADAVVGRFGVKPDGSKTPNVRTVARPLLNLFVGEPSGRKWRRMLDVALLKKPATVAEVVEEAIKCVPDHVLDAPPKRQMPPVFSIGQFPPPTSCFRPAAPGEHGSAGAAADSNSQHAANHGDAAVALSAEGQLTNGMAYATVVGLAMPDEAQWQPGDDDRHEGHRPVAVLQSGIAGDESQERTEKRLKSESAMVGA